LGEVGRGGRQSRFLLTRYAPLPLGKR
jgi:hypothetical protein